MNKEQTPISKYLASLERRQALLTPSPPPDANAIIRKINFEDDTFFQHPDQSMIQVSPSPDTSRGTKRKRLSVLGEMLEEDENQNKKLHDLERLLQQTQGELIDARATNTKLEHQINVNKHAYSAKILGFESSNNEMKMKMREATGQTESYKEQLNKLSRKEEELRERFHLQAEAHLEKISTMEKRLRALETENLELKEKFESGTLKQSDELKRLSANLEETEMGAEKWIMESQMLRDQVELKDKQLQKYQNELKEAQAIICKYNELRAKYDEPKSSDVSSENLQEKIKYFENLYVKQQSENLRLIQKLDKISDENRMLRSSMNREVLLEEQISTFEDEVRALRSTLETKAEVEAENGTLRTQLSAWKNMAFKLDPDCTNYVKFEAYIRKIQNQLLEAKHEGSTLRLEIAEKDRIIAKIQTEVVRLHDQVKRLTGEKDNLAQELKKTTKRLVLITKDRDGLKDLKESYEQEFESIISKPLQDRINQLEETVAGYEAMIQEDAATKKACGECEKRMTLITEIRTEMNRLKMEKADVEAQIANMSVAGRSDGDTTGIKIVSFGLNPSAMSLEARLKEAVKENEELKEKLREIQDQTVANPPREQEGNLRDLEDRNKTLERQFANLKDAYDFETQQLQLILNKLCGFHFVLDRDPNNVQIRLSSIYAPTQNDTFIFQESPNGDMLLLESAILDNFRDDIDRFLVNDGSIPSFLASVTITYAQSHSSQDTSQLPSSHHGAADCDETAADTVSVYNPREVQVHVTRQKHPNSDDEGSDDEDEDHHDSRDDNEDEEGNDDEVEEEEGDAIDGDEHEEEPEDDDDPYNEDQEEEQEDYDDDEESDDEPIPARSRSLFVEQPPSRSTAGDESDDSDIIMLD